MRGQPFMNISVVLAGISILVAILLPSPPTDMTRLWARIALVLWLTAMGMFVVGCWRYYRQR
jgi:hypothetical protein